ncbi:protein artichoke [Caerostris extrusa]|uniref:Protein artichoke n=1 Tax=Caerostris extrusa TaxID=172846 RepID=A0AAV4WCW0_CAEEX|nr:protein artichoke [Caerostris extrusa]
MSDNKLSNVRVDFLFLPSLKHLYLSRNNLTGSNENLFYGLSGLVTLDVEDTGLNPISDRMFEQMNELRVLRLISNDIKTLESRHFASLGFLKELYLDDNEIESIPTNAIETLLTWSGNNIVTIEDDAFLHLTKLKELDLSNNTLKSFASAVFDPLKNLDKLILDGNTFSYLPNTLLNAPLKNIRILSINRNPMVRIRQDLSTTGNFKSLETLRINRANITIIASHDFLGFRNIVHLSLRHNKIVKISPGAFKPLTKLAVLDIGFNNIDILPEERLYGLKKLKTLNLTSNRILNFQFSVRTLNKLRP